MERVRERSRKRGRDHLSILLHRSGEKVVDMLVYRLEWEVGDPRLDQIELREHRNEEKERHNAEKEEDTKG